MMPPEPLKSAMAVATAEDTSLALPSDKYLRGGQQRVLDQVQTVKRSKSKQWKNGTLSHSPTSPSPQSPSEFGTFRFSPTKLNVTSGHFSSTNSAAKGNRSQSTRTQRYLSTSTTNWAQQLSSSNWPNGPNGLKPSRSDPALAPPFSTAPALELETAPVMTTKGQTAQGQTILQTRINRQSVSSVTNGNPMTNSQTRMIRSTSMQSHNEGKLGTIKISKLDQKSAVNSATSMSDMTLKEAVQFLSHPEESHQQCGAIFIQHATFSEEAAKQEVLRLGGIPGLVTLLRSPNPGVSQAAAGALRNLVFKDNNNKLEVQHCGGIAKALQLLKETDSTETQKQITGLLWNLSSANSLKEELISTALPVLTENVVVPFTSWSDSSARNHIDPSVFHCATGCLRNLSGGQGAQRNAMRKCPGLIDSLMSYIQSCVAEENPDDQSVENCACILHNLTYELEKECPESFGNLIPQRNAQQNMKDSTVGCFSPKSSKVQKEFSYDIQGALDDSTPSGVKWLSHHKALETYLALLDTSHNEATLEASCGALQNLTASRGQGSSAVSQLLVNKFRAMYQISSLLKSPNQSLQKTGMSLLSNLSRTNGLQSTVAKQILPELTQLVSSAPRETEKADETLATACNTMQRLMGVDSEVTKKILNNDLVYALSDLSGNNAFPKSSKAASKLLYSLWNEKSLQGVVKKLGIKKSIFINDNTSPVHQLSQVWSE
ncbi:plakophilin-1 [Pholidichthys leucotaenia]